MTGRLSVSICISMTVVWLVGTGQAAITIIGQTTGVGAQCAHLSQHDVISSHTCTDTLNPLDIEPLTAPSAVAQSALGRDFSGWDITYDSSQSWTGTLNIEVYEAVDYSGYRGPCAMGAHLEAAYTAPITESVPRFRWIQIIITNEPATGRGSPYVDGFTKDGYPFYYDEPRIDQALFVDWPSRECPGNGITSWQAELYLAEWYPVQGDMEDNNVRIYEGIRWGFEIDCPAPLVAVPEGDLGNLDIDGQIPPVPAPGAGLLALFGIVLSLRMRRWIGWRAV